MLATTRWYNGTQKIKFADGVVGTVVTTLKHGFVCNIDGKPAHVWTFNVDIANTAKTLRNGVLKSDITSIQALKDGKPYADKLPKSKSAPSQAKKKLEVGTKVRYRRSGDVGRITSVTYITAAQSRSNGWSKQGFIMYAVKWIKPKGLKFYFPPLAIHIDNMKGFSAGELVVIQ